jgi:ABC-type amino acid transport substrate-binding protein
MRGIRNARNVAIVAGIAIVFGAGAAARADSLDMTVFGKDARTLEYPKPWTLRHLITPGELTVGVTGKAPPSSFTNDSGELDGARIKLFKKIGADLDLKVNFVRLDWPGILPGLAANKFDLACEGASVSLTRLQSPDFFLTRPVNANAVVGITMKDSPIKTWTDVGSKRLGGVRGELEFESGKKAAPGAATVDLPGRQEGVLALRNGQIDAFSMDLLAAAALVNDPENADIKIFGPPVDVGVQSVCVNKNEGDLLQAVNLLLTNYRVDGTLSALEKEYFKTDADVSLLSSFGY